MSAPTRPFPGASQPPTAPETPPQTGWREKAAKKDTIIWNPPAQPISPLSLDNFSMTLNQTQQRRSHLNVDKSIRTDGRIFELEKQTKAMQAYINTLQSDLAICKDKESNQNNQMKKVIQMILELSSIESKLTAARKNMELKSEDFFKVMEILEITSDMRALKQKSETLWVNLHDAVKTLNKGYSTNVKPLMLKEVTHMPIIMIYTIEQSHILDAAQAFAAMGIDLLVGVFNGSSGRVSGCQLRSKVNFTHNLPNAVMKIVDILSRLRNEEKKGGMNQYPPHFSVSLLIHTSRLDTVNVKPPRNTYVQRNRQSQGLENCDALKIIGEKWSIASVICDMIGVSHPPKPMVIPTSSSMRPPASMPQMPRTIQRPASTRSPPIPLRQTFQPPRHAPPLKQPQFRGGLPQPPRGAGNRRPTHMPSPKMRQQKVKPPSTMLPSQPISRTEILRCPSIKKDNEWTDVTDKLDRLWPPSK